MGGSAYRIQGEIEPWRLEPQPRKKSLLDRLLGRQRFDALRTTKHGNLSLTTIPAGDLERSIAKAFRNFLDQRILEPWESTQQFLQYVDVMNVYLRGSRRHDCAETKWHVQISFSGCAGAAEVSAELGYHWTYLWLLNELEQVTDTIFKPEGFIPNVSQNNEEVKYVFVPVGVQGYAVYTGASESPQEEAWFDPDGGWREGLDDDENESLSQMLIEGLGPIVADGRCRCQLCMPDFDASGTDSLLNSFCDPRNR